MGGPSEQPAIWWTEGDDMVISLVSPSGPDAIIAALEGREPNATEHPARTALMRSDDARGFVPVGLAFFDMAALPALPKEAVALGLDRIERFDYRFGFDGPAMTSIIGAAAPAPRQGILALFDQPVFDARHLPPLPGGLAGFTVVSLDLAQVLGPVGRNRRSPSIPTAAQTGRRIREAGARHAGPRPARRPARPPRPEDGGLHHSHQEKRTDQSLRGSGAGVPDRAQDGGRHRGQGPAAPSPERSRPSRAEPTTHSNRSPDSAAAAPIEAIRRLKGAQPGYVLSLGSLGAARAGGLAGHAPLGK